MLTTEIASICLNFYSNVCMLLFFFSRNAPSEEENIISIKLKININLIFIFLYVLKHAHSWELDGNRKFEKDETFSLLWCGSSGLCSQDISGRLECCK